MKHRVISIVLALVIATVAIRAQQMSGGGGGTTVTSTTTLASATITTSQPFTVQQTWNAGGVIFNAFLVNATNTASATGSTLADFQIGGVSQFNITKTPQILANTAACSSPPYSFNGNANSGMCAPVASQVGFEVNSALIADFFNGTYNGLGNRGDNVIAWSSSATLPSGTQGANEDTGISRTAAGVLYVGNGAQGDKTGTWGAANVLTVPTTVGALPTCNAGNQGMRAFVTDELAAIAYHTTATGGGSNKVGVTCDGTNWYIN